jgi:uncharacterized OB-fold protein
MTAVAARLTPPLDDENREFWTGGAAGQLRIPFCSSCARWIFPPRLECPGCPGRATYATVSGRGRVFTYTVNHHPFNPEVPLPYVIAIVELVEQDGLRFMTDIVNCAVDSVTIGMPVRVVFEEQGDVFVPLFEPDPAPEVTR